MAPTYKLTYFNARGKAEPIRFLLAYGEAEYEDVRIEPEDWPEIKKTIKFGQVPILEVDGNKISQSVAICRNLAKQFGLAGSNEGDCLQIDVCVDTFNDFKERKWNFAEFGSILRRSKFLENLTYQIKSKHLTYIKRHDFFINCCEDQRYDMFSKVMEYLKHLYYGLNDEVEKNKQKERLMNETIPYYLPKFEEHVSKNRGYFVNGKLSWADLYITAHIENIGNFLGPDWLNQYPNIKAVMEKVQKLPAIKAWIEKRPKTQY